MLLEPVPEAAIPEALAEGLPVVPARPDPVGRCRCVGSFEPLVAISGPRIAVLDAYAALGILPPRVVRCRSGVMARLARAGARLPDGFGFVVLDAWRSLDEQQALLAHYANEGDTSGYVAEVSPDGPRPPHVTGGALDLTLSFRGVPLALGTDFDSFVPDAWHGSLDESDNAVRRLRRLLGLVLTGEDFVPYPREWWHWSYGEDWWAAARGCASRYEVVSDDCGL